MLMLGILGYPPPHYSLAAWINWNINFDDPMRVTASLLPAPECNAIQEFVCASELIELGFPVSSPSGVEPAGDLDSATAPDFGADFAENYTTLAQIGADLEPKGLLQTRTPLQPNPNINYELMFGFGCRGSSCTNTASSSSLVEPAGVLASSSASPELIEPSYPVSSSSSHVAGLQGHPFGVEPAGSSSSVAAPHLTT